MLYPLERTLAILFTAWQLFGCTRTEPSLVPLGHGPLSLAEREAAAAPTRRGIVVDPIPVPSCSECVTDAAVPASSVRTEQQDAGTKITASSASRSTTSPEDATQPSGLASLEKWLGLYRGNDTTVYKLPGQSDRSFDDPKARIRVERASKGNLDFVLVDSSNNSDMCRLSGVVQGDTATIEAGQSCFLEPDADMTVKSKPGTATLSERRLIFNLVLDTVMDTESGRVNGTIEYHFSGER